MTMKEKARSVMCRDSTTAVYTVTLSYLRICCLIVRANTPMRKSNAEVQRRTMPGIGQFSFLLAARGHIRRRWR